VAAPVVLVLVVPLAPGRFDPRLLVGSSPFNDRALGGACWSPSGGGPGRLFAVREHVEVEATWGIYQRMIAAYREPDRARGRELMEQLITSVSQGVPATLTEVITLGER
jgi:hypothetical protein